MVHQAKISEELDDVFWKEVIRPTEVVRDPVHKDIEITELEYKIINTTTFLRLIGIKQLGFTYLVYPGAVHNRFQHSLGTLHMAKQIITYCNKNAENNPLARQIPPYSEFLIRLFSLLHDLAHVPFGHTLDDEGNLFPKQWKDPNRGIILETITGFIQNHLHDEYGISKKNAAQVTEELKKIIITEEPLNLERPYIADIVNNTICADLLDYIYRDIYFTGLNERIGDRFLRYLAILPLVRILDENEKPLNEYRVIDGKNEIVGDSNAKIEKDTDGEPIVKERLVLTLYQYDKRKRKEVTSQSPLSEAIDLIRKRYSLAEKVYFHRTKISTSAMIIAAVQAAGYDSKTLIEKTDDELMYELLNNNSSERSKRIAKNLNERRLYKPIFSRNFMGLLPEGGDAEPTTLKNVSKKYRNKKERERLERQIEDATGIPQGSIVVYCPDENMNLKHFRMLVHGKFNSGIKPLEDFVTDWIHDEIKAIKNSHKALWRFQIFVDPSVADPREYTNPTTQEIAGACSSILQLSNGIIELRGFWHNPLELKIDRAVGQWNKQYPENPVTTPERDGLKDICSRNTNATVETIYSKIVDVKSLGVKKKLTADERRLEDHCYFEMMHLFLTTPIYFAVQRNSNIKTA